MFRRHLKMAVRQIGRNKAHTTVVVACLGLGIAVSLLAAAFLVHEFSFESSHVRADRIHQVYLDEYSSSFGSMTLATAALPLGPALAEASDGVEEVVRFRRYRQVEVHGERSSLPEQVVLAVEPAFTRTFSQEFLVGNPEVDLGAPGSVYLAESLAEGLFGLDDPIGKAIKIGDKHELYVTGLFRDMPTNTKLRCDALMPLASIEASGTDLSDWSSVWSDYLFVLLAPHCSAGDVEAVLPSILSQHVGEDTDASYHYALSPLTDLYFSTGISNALPPSGSRTQVALAAAIALATLLIACFNFINLTTARASNRLSEMVMRKVVGASRSHLIGQLVVETCVPAILAAILGMVLFELSHQVLTSVLGRSVSVGLLQNWTLPAIVLLLVGAITLIAGLYPAFYVSRPRFVTGVTNMSHGRRGKAYLRKSLVILQFAAAVVISIMATIVYVQLDFSQTWDKGFETDGMMVFKAGSADSTATTVAFRQELARLPGVLGETGCSILPGVGTAAMDSYRLLGQPEESEEMIQVFDVQASFATVMGLQAAQGRLFDESDLTGTDKILVDRKTVETLGLVDPIGATLVHNNEECTVVGVLDEFHARPTYLDEFPLMLRIDRDASWHELVRLAPGDRQVTIQRVEEVWSRFFPAEPFVYEFYGDILSEQYGSYYRLGTLFLVFSGVFVIIAGLGMFSMATLAANRRRREIGIRKVFGASTSSVVGKLGAEFLLLVGLANLVGIPVAWYLGSRWLDNFVYRTELGPALFVVCGLGTILVAMISVMIQTIKAAHANPVESLRYE